MMAATAESAFMAQVILIIIGAIVTGVVAGIGSAMVWFKGSKIRIYGRLEKAEGKMELLERELHSRVDVVERTHSEHNVRMERVETCQENTARELANINIATRDIVKKVDQLVLVIVGGNHNNKED